MNRKELLKALNILDKQLKENVKNYSHMSYFENIPEPKQIFFRKRQILFIVTTNKKLIQFNITDLNKAEIANLIVSKLDGVGRSKKGA